MIAFALAAVTYANTSDRRCDDGPRDTDQEGDQQPDGQEDRFAANVDSR
jgi:hypothetical protein